MVVENNSANSVVVKWIIWKGTGHDKFWEILLSFDL